MGNTRGYKGCVEMSEARDLFKLNPVKYFPGYIYELEQQITELKESQKQKQIIKLCERLDKAEQQNKQMIEALRMIKHKLETDPAITDTIWIDDTPKCSETAVDRINYLLGIKE